MTLLWHAKCGPILAATQNEYIPYEPQNMQLLRCGEPILNMTPRIEAGAFSNVYDDAFSFSADPEKRLFTVRGFLTDINGKALALSDGARAVYTVSTAFTAEEARITLSSQAEDSAYHLPVIAAREDEVVFSEKRVLICRNDARIVLSTDWRFEAPFGVRERRFNPVGGFDHLMLLLPLAAGKETTVSIRVE